MQNPLPSSRLHVVVPVLLCLLLAVGCQSTRKPAEASARGNVDTAGWETPAAAHPDQAEMEEIRRRNQELSARVSDLSEKVKEMQEAESASAALPVAPAEPRVPAAASRVAVSSADADRLAAAVRKAGISDLEVSVSDRGETLVLLPGSLAFRAGSADLMKSARTRLKRLAEVLRATSPGVSLRIEGHTDSDPIRKSHWESNHQLSGARASAVAKYFVRSLGWSDARTSARGYGADRPVATNSTREGKARNRRIEIVLVP